ncbi:hypothetical protein TREMEDRAFT_67959 [Tremella mesenterica DSM 1558]|uniref:uncharacterized protein n=1 Tax=Tremella mesenterica (strain ATCC 24925 / CBS 8224 / DSM 1558 / NBRC 9311 / NRRL Y-6157 / RJB 2259-6 / UBC 559-6) TaxID=578456 RepID=UPI0003F4A4C4|nr:uncharacterized protein TREMEDRAFT_67959 [Tremella mesenterica DSM 1558]EIW71780.1 hypothetical protein TREMEDRAFT_67959 [Tremella mesenterica DSM 1558]
MPTCPVCTQEINADPGAFQHHVNQHFDPSPSPTVVLPLASPVSRTIADNISKDPLTCVVCGYPLESLSSNERFIHVNGCLDEGMDIMERDDFGVARSRSYTSTTHGGEEPDYDLTQMRREQDDDDDFVEVEWEGPARPGGWHDWAGKKPHRGDRWWDPIQAIVKDNNLPANFSPGLMPVLDQLLKKSVAEGYTKSAVLCSDTVHIKGAWGFDMAWGCGYRNALMSISALLISRPAYRPVFSKEANGAEPGVRRIQGWIEEAWEEGYDRQGAEHFKGKLLGSRKWIGTSDLYAMFTSKGIPAAWHLQQWVKQYFNEDTPHRPEPNRTSAFDVLMRTEANGQGRGEVVRQSSKLPLILQHSGHSRTIVGYEETSRGDINLLLFDPGKSVPRPLRSQAISQLSTTPLPRRKTLSRTHPFTKSHESLSFSRPISNGASEIVPSPFPDNSPSLPPSLRSRASRIESIRAISISSIPSRSASSSSGIPSNIATASSSSRITRVATISSSNSEPPSLRETSTSSYVSPNRLAGGSKPSHLLASDEETDSAGWVRKNLRRANIALNKNASDTKMLDIFRVGLGGLSGKGEYQILRFTGGNILDNREKENRKVINSSVII